MDVASQIEQMLAAIAASAGGGEVIEGQNGWLFLAGDTNDQLSQQFGFKVWTDADVAAANAVIEERTRKIGFYRKFIVPEKSIVYGEFLPDALRSFDICSDRPALKIDGSYLLPTMAEAKARGPLYFRGDSHPNWLGSHCLYEGICREMGVEPLARHRFSEAKIGYDGDLFEKMAPAEQVDLLNRVPHGKFTLDDDIRIDLLDPSASLVGDGGYRTLSRPTVVYESSDRSLPTAVVFRDSMSQFFIPWLAEHFSRVVFAWHRGEVVGDLLDAERPDMVIHIMAERFLWNYPQRAAFVSAADRRISVDWIYSNQDLLI